MKKTYNCLVIALLGSFALSALGSKPEYELPGYKAALQMTFEERRECFGPLCKEKKEEFAKFSTRQRIAATGILPWFKRKVAKPLIKDLRDVNVDTISTLKKIQEITDGKFFFAYNPNPFEGTFPVNPLYEVAKKGDIEAVEWIVNNVDADLLKEGPKGALRGNSNYESPITGAFELFYESAEQADEYRKRAIAIAEILLPVSNEIEKIHAFIAAVKMGSIEGMQLLEYSYKKQYDETWERDDLFASAAEGYGSQPRKGISELFEQAIVWHRAYKGTEYFHHADRLKEEDSAKDNFPSVIELINLGFEPPKTTVEKYYKAPALAKTFSKYAIKHGLVANPNEATAADFADEDLLDEDLLDEKHNGDSDEEKEA